MSDPFTVATVGLNVLGGLFGKKKDPTPRDNILSQAAGARAAADKYGFNPLTLLQYGNPAGAMGGGGSPPLASFQLLADGLSALDPEAKRDREIARKKDELNLEIAKINLEKARSGVALVANSAADSAGNGPSPLGRRAASVFQRGSADGSVKVHSSGYGAAGAARGLAVKNWTGLEPIPSHIPVLNRNGQITYVVNPAMPDADQLVFEGANAAAAALQEKFPDLAKHDFAPSKAKGDKPDPVSQGPRRLSDLTPTQRAYLARNGYVKIAGRSYKPSDFRN